MRPAAALRLASRPPVRLASRGSRNSRRHRGRRTWSARRFSPALAPTSISRIGRVMLGRDMPEPAEQRGCPAHLVGLGRVVEPACGCSSPCSANVCRSAAQARGLPGSLSACRRRWGRKPPAAGAWPDRARACAPPSSRSASTLDSRSSKWPRRTSAVGPPARRSSAACRRRSPYSGLPSSRHASACQRSSRAVRASGVPVQVRVSHGGHYDRNANAPPVRATAGARLG